MDNRGKPGGRRRSTARTPVQDRAREKKARIVEAAFELFSRRGYDAVGMRDIAAAAGVSIGTVYAYFSDKKNIFVEIFASYSDEFRDELLGQTNDDPSDTVDIEESIYRVIKRFAGILSRRLRIQRDVVILSLIDDEIRAVHESFEREARKVIVGAFLERYGDRIEVRDADAATLVVHKAMDEIIQYLLFYEVPIDRDRVFRETARMIARYLEKR